MRFPHLPPSGLLAIALDLAAWTAIFLLAPIVKSVILARIGVNLRTPDLGDHRIWVVEWLTPVIQLPLLTLLLHLRGERWADLLLVRPGDWATFALAVVGVTVASVVIAELIQRLPRLWGGRWPPSRYLALRGRPRAVAALLVNTVFLVGLTEELATRGVLLSRIALALGNRPEAWVGGAIVTAVVFGALHFQHGIATMLAGVTIGLLYGAVYLVTGNLWVVVAAHSLHDTVRVLWLASPWFDQAVPTTG